MLASSVLAWHDRRVTFNFDVNVNVTVTCPQLDSLISQNTAIQNQLATIYQGVKSIMAKTDEELALIKKVDETTSQMADTLVTESTTLQSISDRGKEILAQLQNGDVPQSVMDALGGLFTHVQAVGDNLKTTATFSDQVLKDLNNPIPGPVPPPTPPGPTPEV